MRTIVIMAAVVVGLGIGTLTLAQQGGDQAKQKADEQRKQRTEEQEKRLAEEYAKLRSQLAKLRAEVELSQIEHETDVLVLKDLMKGAQELEMSKTMATQVTGSAANLRAALGIEGNDKTPEDGVKKEAQANEMIAKTLLPYLERKRKEFLKKTAELNEKEIDLEQLEAQLHGGT